MLEALYIYRNRDYTSIFDPDRGHIYIGFLIFYKYMNPMGSFLYSKSLF